MVALSTHNSIRLPDGRELGYAEYGHSEGDPILYFHGVPGSRLSGLLAGVLAAPRGGRVIALDRPGYGISDFQPGRRLLDWPQDVVALADHLGIERFAILGYSGGGPFAAACAHALPDRVTSLAIVSGMGPLSTPEAARLLTRAQRLQHFCVRRSPFVVSLLLRHVAGRVLIDPERYLVSRNGQTPACDQEVMLRPTIRAMMKEDLVEAFAQGSAAAVQDVRLLAGPWGFSLADVKVPVHLWHGEADSVVPCWLGRHVAEAIPGCRASFVREAGHMLFVDHMDAILGSLLEESAGAQRHPSHRRNPGRRGSLARTA
jgi:pimeloyl-ACP methyl ester carboxylesterase